MTRNKFILSLKKLLRDILINKSKLIIYLALSVYFICLVYLYNNNLTSYTIFYIISTYLIIRNLNKKALLHSKYNTKNGFKNVIIFLNTHKFGVLIYCASIILCWLAIASGSMAVVLSMGLFFAIGLNIIEFNQNKVCSFNKKETLSSFLANKYAQDAKNWTGLLIMLIFIFVISLLTFIYYFNQSQSSSSWWFLPFLVSISSILTLTILFFSRNRNNLLLQSSEYTDKYYMEQFYEDHKNDERLKNPKDPLAIALINSVSKSTTSSLIKNPNKKDNTDTLETIKIIANILDKNKKD